MSRAAEGNGLLIRRVKTIDGSNPSGGTTFEAYTLRLISGRKVSWLHASSNLAASTTIAYRQRQVFVIYKHIGVKCLIAKIVKQIIRDHTDRVDFALQSVQDHSALN